MHVAWLPQVLTSVYATFKIQQLWVKEIIDAGGRAFGKIMDITKGDRVKDFVALMNEA